MTRRARVRRVVREVVPFGMIALGCVQLAAGGTSPTVFGVAWVAFGAWDLRDRGRAAGEDLGRHARAAADLARAQGDTSTADELVRYADARRLPWADPESDPLGDMARTAAAHERAYREGRTR